jgi:tripartite-type tricarboxylate transporter receptor subunit TctC
MKVRSLAFVLATFCAPPQAQTWQPQRHVEISSPGGAGGALDTTARQFGLVK